MVTTTSEFEAQFGRDLIDQTLNRVLGVYASLFANAWDPLRKNEVLAPVLKDLEGVDANPLLDLLEHASIMTLHSALNHFTSFENEGAGYSLSVRVCRGPEQACDLLDYVDWPGGYLVSEEGWVEEFLDYRETAP
ncbi:MAG: hypothetical protein AAGI09_03510 [Pseudomonadota bacterium]